jgi:8-oxo-dGTP diphosphatase
MNISKYKSHEGILVAVDCIIFGFDSHQLQALLIKRGFEPEKGKWSLMGGFVEKNESTDVAAIRILQQLTGMKNIYMEQLYCFSNVNRDTAGRVISVAYFALINIADYSEQLQQDHEARWFALDSIPKLIFDHKEMIAKAKERLREKVGNHPIGFELLPEKFTLRQLQNLYEAIYEQALDKRNFTRKFLLLKILNKLREKEKGTSRKGSFYFVFDKQKYKRLHQDRVRFI